MDGIIVINKEAGYTSNDVVAILRGILHMKKIGHTGTLDPDAVGCLPMCLGKGTRMADILTASEKQYEARMEFGYETDTGDTSGKVTRRTEFVFKREEFEAAVASMVGDILQVPPMYSALKVGGVHLYDLARQGKEVERKARPIHIEAIDILEVDEKGARIRVTCSKGTYIRTLIEDIGRKCGYLGVMAHLNRLRSGMFSLDQALTLAQVKECAENGTLEEHLFTMEHFFMDYPRLQVEEEWNSRLLNGNPLVFSLEKLQAAWTEKKAESASSDTEKTLKEDQILRIADAQGEFKALYKVSRITGSEVECKAYKMF